MIINTDSSPFGVACGHDPHSTWEVRNAGSVTGLATGGNYCQFNPQVVCVSFKPNCDKCRNAQSGLDVTGGDDGPG